jgi:hypothetical protein
MHRKLVGLSRAVRMGMFVQWKDPSRGCSVSRRPDQRRDDDFLFPCHVSPFSPKAESRSVRGVFCWLEGLSRGGEESRMVGSDVCERSSLFNTSVAEDDCVRRENLCMHFPFPFHNIALRLPVRASLVLVAAIAAV